MKLKNWGGNTIRVTLLLTLSLIFNSCSSSDEVSKLTKNYYVTPLQTNSKTISGVDLSSGKLTLNQSDIRGKKLLNFARVYNSLNKDNNNSFGNFKLSLNSKINPKLIYNKEPIASKKYLSPQEACLFGFEELKDKIYLGKLSNAQAVYNDRLKTCDIYEDSKIKATLLIKDASKKALANKDLILLKKPNGKELLFFKNRDSIYQSLTKEPITLEKTNSGYKVTYNNDLIEEYDNRGNLIKLQKEASFINIAYSKNGKIKSLNDNYNKTITFNYDINSSLITSVTNYDDTNTTYTYDKSNNLIKVSYPDNSTKSYEYNQDNKLTAIINASGVKIRVYEYEDNKVISTAKAKGANKQSFAYSSDTTTVTKNGVANEYSFKIINSIAKVKTITSDEGEEAYSYDEKGNPTSYTNKLGVKTLTTYNDRGLLVSKVSNAGTKDEQITLISYHDRLHKPTKVVKAGVATFYEYNTKGLLTKKIIGSVNPAFKKILPNNKALIKSLKVEDTTEQKVYAYEYDENGNPIKNILPNGAENKTKYDKAGNPIEQINALGFSSKVLKVDKAGRPLESIDYNGIITKTKYDAMGRVLETNVDGKVTKYEYDKNGRVTKTTYPDGTYSYSKYDDRGNVIESGDSWGNKTLNKYDKNNNLIETKSYKNDKLIYASKSRYDNKNRLIASIDSFGNETKYIYNQKGQKIKTIDALNRETKYEYDNLGRLIKTIYPDGTFSSYTYNAKGLKTKVTTPNSSTFTFSYDNFDRTIKKASSDSAATTLTYDISDNIKTKTDANGNTITYEYDIANRKTKETLSNDRGSEEVSYKYDEGENAKGKLTTVTDSAQTTHYSYDKDGNIINIEQTINNNTFTRSFTYNDKNKLTQEILPSGKVINYHYNDKEELSSIDIDGQTLIDSITKNQNGLVSYNYPNGNTHTREYDTNGRVVKLIYPNYTETITYDKVSNITKLIEDRNKTKTFAYDLRDRLTNYQGLTSDDNALALSSAGLTLKEYQNFSYDSNGNRLTLNQEVNKTISYLYKEKSNILQTIAHYKRVDENNTQKVKEITLSYDKAGNIIGDDKHIYTYDAKNRLVKIDNNITYTYNYKNQRVSKSVNNKTTYYIYDDYKLIGEYNEDGTPIKEYIYLDDTPIAILQDNKVYYIYADHLNTPRRVATSQDYTIVWKWESKPFGEDKPTGTYTLNLRFPGQYFDKESGFSYNINRYYNPTLGRYMQSDPIGLEGGENSFVYVGDNPLVRVDESGYSWADKFTKALISYAKRKVDILLSKARYIDKYSNKKYAVYDKDGNFEDVIKDFKDLPVANVRVTRNSDGMTVYIGDLDDGRRVIARSGSGKRSGNIPTLEIQPSKGAKERTIKIRYTPKLPFYDEPLGTGLGPIDTIIGAAIDGLF